MDKFKSSLVGTPVPLCSCGVVPVGMELKKKGLGTSATASFLIATPKNGIDSILLTQSFFGGFFTLLRVSFSVLLANFVGFVVGLVEGFDSVGNEEKSSDNSKVSCCSSNHNHKVSENKKDPLDYILDTFLPDLVPWLLGGFLLSASISTFVPQEFFETMSSSTGVVAAALIGIPLYVCASASTPIAYSLLLSGLSPGAVFVFLLTGPATNSSNIPLYVRELGFKQTLAFYSSLFLGSIGIGLLINSLALDFSAQVSVVQHDHSSESVIQIIIGTLIFSALVFWSYYRRYHSAKKKDDTCCGS